MLSIEIHIKDEKNVQSIYCFNSFFVSWDRTTTQNVPKLFHAGTQELKMAFCHEYSFYLKFGPQFAFELLRCQYVGMSLQCPIMLPYLVVGAPNIVVNV